MKNSDLKHYYDDVNEQINKLDKTKDELVSLRSKIWSFMNPSEFKCPKYTNKEAICPKCYYVLPHVWENRDYKTGFTYLNYDYPHGMNDVDILRTKFNVVGCKEWMKKIEESTCGCGGSLECECGYYTTFCTTININKCKFCGREVKILLSGINNIFIPNLTSLESKNEITQGKI